MSNPLATRPHRSGTPFALPMLSSPQPTAHAWRRAAAALPVALALLSAPLAAGRASAAITYVGRVGSITQGTSSTTVALTTTRQVAAGDAVLVAVLLSSTTITGAVSVTDGVGNTYTLDRDVNDGSARDRVLIYSARNAISLPSGGRITITYPTSAECHASADEFAGLVSLDTGAGAFATSTSFNSGNTATTAQPTELLFGVVGEESGTTPVWASGWTALPVLSIGTDRIDAAYRVSSATGQFAASGTASGTWMAGIATYTGGPVPEAAPVARLSVTQLASPALTAKADGSTSTDGDATPIATYHFDFGDGYTVDTPTSTAQHTYGATGTYTVKLSCTDTGGLNSSQVSQSITISSAPVDNPPVAHLSVTQAASPALTANADGSASTDGDATPIATWHFDFGDGFTVDKTTATAQHTYAAAGTYTVKLTCTDTGNLTSSQVSQSITINPPATGGGTFAVYAGYYDTHHPHVLQPKPNPWRTSSNVVFVGNPDKSGGDDWDSSALRVENLSGTTLSNVVVTADIGSNHYALWGTHSIPPGYSLIMTQTAFDNFDGSDRNTAGCYSCNPKLCLTSVSSVIPVIKVTVNGVTTVYNDTKQLLNTGGVDRAGCPYTGTRNDESENWQQVFASAAQQMAADRANGTEEQTPIADERKVLWLGNPYPNPSHGDLTVRFTLPVAAQVKLEVYDVTGRLVRQIANQDMPAGVYQNVTDLRAAEPGIYFYRLTTPQGVKSRPFVISR